ncbi:methyltransferase family protein [Albidovulum inexpectatum]|uniref:Methyltransferase family protein n=1 Tax=Albidovulum inexpectatum TaxID=196587 RepID=A0A2S5JE76_9RHOB|nr:class I SAM-dependent methyltransferase [Albidovulum inexpectatum]PPB79814.1 methyltransferase family protein [Albidovulum inexpectatum]
MTRIGPSRVRWFHGGRARILYNLISWHLRNATDLRFMNYGYAEEADAGNDGDQTERLCARLYDAVVASANLAGARILDVGSGRGGGALHLLRHHGAEEVTGVDYSARAIEFCRRVYENENRLSWLQGDAAAIPVPDGQFDIVTNVESAHCYPDRRAFLREAFRVLRPGGWLLHADFTPQADAPSGHVSALASQVTRSGFQDIRVTELTQGVLLGLSLDAKRRGDEITRRFPAPVRPVARLWAGLPGSWIHRDFASGRRLYYRLSARKPE